MWGDVREMLGLTLSAVDGGAIGDESIMFHTTCGRRFEMYHDQSCCEYVRIVDVVGDLTDLFGVPLLRAEQSSNATGDEGTWTYYKLGTVKGDVDIRWLGTSNGYYSEEVDFCERDRISGGAE